MALGSKHKKDSVMIHETLLYVFDGWIPLLQQIANERVVLPFDSISDSDSSATEPISLNHEEHVSGLSSSSSSSSSINTSSKSASRE